LELRFNIDVAWRAEYEQSIFGDKLNIDLKAFLIPAVSSVNKLVATTL